MNNEGILIGCDPEFSVSSFTNFPVPLDKVMADVNNGGTEKFGKDHCGRMLEVRPAPSENPDEVVARIRHILQMGMNKYSWLNNSNMIARPYVNGDSLGGHVHIGIYHIPRAGDLDYGALTASIGYVVGILAALYEPPHLGKSRRTNNVGGTIYGYLNDVREQDHGPEMRCFSTWLSSPMYATFVLTACKDVAEYWLANNGKSIIATSDYISAQIAYDKHDHIALRRKHLDKAVFALHQAARSQKSYNIYTNFIDLIKNGKTQDNESINMVDEWGLERPISELPKIRFYNHAVKEYLNV